MSFDVTVIGAGMAGSEAAWQAAQRGAKVRLVEMRPKKLTPAHQSDKAAEIVCSNSFKSNHISNASGLLKDEMRKLDSLIVSCADATSVPAGEALAVDREAFSELVTERLLAHPSIEFVRDEATEIPGEGKVIIASGPLTSDALAAQIGQLTGRYDLYFYDAVAPIVDASTIDYTKVFRASRRGKGLEADTSDDAAYLNCPMNKEEYTALWQAITEAELAPVHDFEDIKYFEACLPVEELARRGERTLSFGPLKPVGLEDPRTGRRPWAVVQLRQENKAGTLYNLVGFQTRMKWGAQKKVLQLIPGLENAEFVRFGVMHRNTYIHSPSLLDATLALKSDPRIRFAGQIVGVEGYLESAAMGLIAGLNSSRETPIIFPQSTSLGCLTHYVAHYEGKPKDFAPMNANWGMMPPLEGDRIRDKKERGRAMAARGQADFDKAREQVGL
ncbi:methylenetetrahydrofolate--tRNA-(uracil-5-)-methyltransferase [Armatimonas rosea]|uniref:Methylenetetrahydrofolate--tRNA-(uracil-5-)-methyltransferase TrmFO n=2 Tax=Armatimonas rosea TaxID=685828 RepID=A0A7W9SQ60_ARMRO|nr:methylenetetrahydrofolate--tRNA-(uracil(54)-C(5))-methyltransferase (FADH(2)-oxidizing) TrmFO [Armatimonas rosea]MBB6050154.1 methylenetetrahydrofolate--tRNA-(uracil-5-)-methyltransferase [Armatimonas rosea]